MSEKSSGQKRVLILGAGFMQGRAVEAARKKGWRVALVDGNPSAVCAPLADVFKPIDLKDKEKIADFALDLKAHGGLDGVFTCATDFSLSVAWVARACGLPSHSVEAAAAASDKLRMREIFAAASVPSPKFAALSAAEIPCAADALASAGIAFPVVVKPADNMGARGCKKVLSAEGLRAALESAVAFSKTGRAIAEEFMDGPEFSLEALVYDGQFHETGFADRHIFFPPYFIEMGHTIPSGIPEAQRRSALEVFYAGASALGLNYGAVKGDIKITARGAMVGEIAGRLSGGYMSGWTFPHSSGIDLTSAALDLCVGDRPASLAPKKHAVSAERAWISVPGTVASVSGTEQAADIPCVKHVFPLKKAGDAVVFPRSNVEKCGNCIAVADIEGEGYEAARARAVFAAEEACRSVVVRLAAGKEETAEFLFRFFEGGASTCSRATEDTADSPAFPPPCFPLPFAEVSGGSLPSLFSGGWGALALREGTGAEETVELLVPEILRPRMAESTDWHGRSLVSSLRQAFSAEPALRGALLQAQKNDTLLLMKYWVAFLRGGIQGLLYVFDCA